MQVAVKVRGTEKPQIDEAVKELLGRLFSDVTAESANPEEPKHLASTGCVDAIGRKIHFGQEIVIKCEESNYQLISATVRARPDGKPGFCVPFKAGKLVWDADGTPCYEVFTIE